MPKRSAGLLMYRYRGGVLEVFLAHPGGPFWAKKDLGAWTIPKGEYPPEEDALAAAQREFAEETGCSFHGELFPLTPLRQPSGKLISAWAFEGDCDPAALHKQHLHPGVAAPLRPTTGVPGSRPGGLVLPGRSQR